jgi:NAD(P)-dependent dehydrogenase (short-subunit alcohol dehydrogenase family)
MSEARVWLVTGASSGLGRAIAAAALAAGDTVAAAARSTGGLADLAAAYPGRVDPVALDVSDTARAEEVVAGVADRHGRLDVLVNSAGRALVGAVEETTDQELRDLMDVHFFGPAALTRAALPYLRRRRSGAVVQITSMGGRMSFAGVGAYSATKFALEGLSEALAAEVGPLGIRVLIVEPGAFRTSLHRGGVRAETAPNPAYDDIVGPVRAAQADFDGKQPGDPAKAAAAILAALDADEPPLRLVLGNDAADAIAASLDTSRAELAAWESVSRGTDIDT